MTSTLEELFLVDLFPYKSPPADASVNMHGVEINREQVYSQAQDKPLMFAGADCFISVKCVSV